MGLARPVPGTAAILATFPGLHCSGPAAALDQVTSILLKTGLHCSSG